MFNRQTLLIVGAGASAEVDFPVGLELARNIGAKMDIRFEWGTDPIGSGDYDLYSHIVHSHRRYADQFQQAAWRIRDGIPFAQSIDDFLDQHRTDQYVNLYGKAAVVQAIVEAERNSQLFFNRAEGIEMFDAQKLADTWFTKFMYMLCRGIPREDVNKIFEKVAFIVFNYDRCIEHFLIYALQRAYSLRLEEAVTLIDGLAIIHPYGSVGSLSQVPFGATRINCVRLSEGIKTYTEQADDKTVLQQIEREVGKAEQIIFLGFAFHAQNMKMLPILDRPTHNYVYGTIFRMPPPNANEAQGSIIRSLAPKQIYLDKLKCAELLEHYSMRFTSDD